LATDSFVQVDSGRSKLGNYNLGIGDSWIKAITEIITNSHQNYHQYWNELGLDKKKENPMIIIIADPHRETFTTVDNGTGITEDLAGIKSLIGEYSGYIEKSHTAKGRSSFARGMSDVLLRTGNYRNQILSHKNGKCVAIEVFWRYNDEKEDSEPVFQINKKITEKEIKQYIPEHGTQITFNWSNKIENRKFPSKKQMLDSIQKYYELKNLLNDKYVDVQLIYLDSKPIEQTIPIKLEFVNYQNNADQVGKTLSDVSLPIDPLTITKGKDRGQVKNYDIRIISAKMFRTKNVILNQKRGEERTGGLFIEGESNKAVYDLTLFDQERNYRDASLKMIGEVVLSDDAKNYMDDYYTNKGTPLLTRTREGFDTRYGFYKELKKKIEPWLVGILESESQSSMTPKTDRFDKGIKKLDELARQLLDTTNLESGQDTGDAEGEDKSKTKLPDTIQFSPESAEVEQGKKYRLSLKINCEKIDPKTKVSFRIAGVDSAHYDIKWDTEHVPKPNKKNLAKIPIYIKCNEIGATAEIIAETKKKNGEKTGEKYCFLKCIDTPLPPNPLTEYLEFIPKKTTAETNVDKQVNLWAHQILDPGTKITVKFTCETHDFEPPITFESDGRQKIETGTHTFEIEVPNTPLEPNAYRKIPIVFTGTASGLRGKIVADSNHQKVIPTTCEIEITNDQEGGNLLSGWEIINSSYQRYSWYEPDPKKVMINVAIPFVRKIIGKDRDEVEARCEKLPEAQVFVAHTILDTFLDEVVTRLFNSRKEVFSSAEPTYIESHEEMVLKKQDLMREYGKEILDEFAPDIRANVTGGDVKSLVFKKENLEFNFWELDMESNVIPPISFNELKEFAGKPADLSLVHFVIKGQAFEIAIYKFADDKFVTALHNFDKGGNYKAIQVLMPELEKSRMIFRKPQQIPASTTIDEPVFSIVKITQWIGETSSRTTQKQLKFDQFDEIPDAPEINHSNILIENSSNWLTEDSKPLVQYAKHSEVISDSSEDNLVCQISQRNVTQMAKMFVRTKIVPAFASWEKAIKDLKKNISAAQDEQIKCSNKKCNTIAEETLEIITKFGTHEENGKFVPNSLCKKCKS